REYNEINAGHRDAYLLQIRADAGMYALVEAIGYIAIGAVLWWASQHRLLPLIGGSVAATNAAIGIIWAFYGYITQFFEPIRDLSAKYAVAQGAMAASERIFQLLDTEELDGDTGDRDATKPEDQPKRKPDAGPAVELAGVHFSYGAEPVLRGVDVRIARG